MPDEWPAKRSEDDAKHGLRLLGDDLANLSGQKNDVVSKYASCPVEMNLKKRFGKGIILLPDEGSWDSFIESTAKFSADFMEMRDQGGEQKREVIFE